MAEVVNDRRRTEPASPSKSGPVARFIEMAVGAWVFLSAFVLAQSDSTRTNSWVCGALVVLFAIIALRAPTARFVNTSIAVWLFITSFSFPHVSEATVWNNWICAVVIFFVSLVPGGVEPAERHPPRRLVRA
jgi:SPW repeat